MTTTTDPFDPHYLDELDLRHELTVVFGDVLSRGDVAGNARWLPALEAALAEHPVGPGVDERDAALRSLSPAEQDAVVDAWSAALAADRPTAPDPAGLLPRGGADQAARDVSALVRRALQVRVRNDGVTPRLWIDRTFAGQRAGWARALVRSFGTAAGGGSCRCLDEPLLSGWQCCGSPWLDNGDIERFIRRARRNVALLDDALHAGPGDRSTGPINGSTIRPITRPIADPVCRWVVTEAYLTYIGGPAAERVVAALNP